MNKTEIVKKIKKLKKEKDVIILAHNYQIGEVQDSADFLGDSLGLSIEASKVKEKIILFCGVRFMAETAAILSPDKTVLIPDKGAGCPMASMISASEIREWKQDYPGKKVVCYVNSTADVKAECDICCTSSNAVKIVNSLEDNEVLFAPDKNLASWVSKNTEKKIIPWDGYCYVHNNMLAKDVKKQMKLHPDAEVWVHPECRPEVVELADKVFSTGHMVREAGNTDKKNIIIGTEEGIIYRLKKENPDKNFFAVKSSAICSNMKKINLVKVLQSLENMTFKVTVPDDIAKRARVSIERMLAV
ncbi:MAG: quinolinate synthase NadA [Candidatus Aminicenantaceae bacterium]